MSPHTIALSVVLALVSLRSVRVGVSGCVGFSEPVSGSVAVYVYDIDMLTDRLSQHRCLHMRLSDSAPTHVNTRRRECSSSVGAETIKHV